MEVVEDVGAAVIPNKKGQKGKRNVRKERRMLKVAGLQHRNYKSVEVPARDSPVAEVSEFFHSL